MRRGAFFFFFILASFYAPKLTAEPVLSDLQSEGLLAEVYSSVESPYKFDWRKFSSELDVGYGYIDEANNFENEVYQLMFAVPMNNGFAIRGGLRRVQVYQTNSSNMVGRTPFKQEAGVNRYQVVGGVAYSLLEGRNMTRLSPGVTDLQHVLWAVADGHYAHQNKGLLPSTSDKPEAYPGQKPVNSKFVLELGLRWSLYFPSAFGLYFESLLNVPLASSEHLRNWAFFAGGVSWAFGVK